MPNGLAAGPVRPESPPLPRSTRPGLRPRFVVVGCVVAGSEPRPPLASEISASSSPRRERASLRVGAVEGLDELTALVAAALRALLAVPTTLRTGVAALAAVAEGDARGVGRVGAVARAAAAVGQADQRVAAAAEVDQVPLAVLGAVEQGDEGALLVVRTTGAALVRLAGALPVRVGRATVPAAVGATVARVAGAEHRAAAAVGVVGGVAALTGAHQATGRGLLGLAGRAAAARGGVVVDFALAAVAPRPSGNGGKGEIDNDATSRRGSHPQGQGVPAVAWSSQVRAATPRRRRRRPRLGAQHRTRATVAPTAAGTVARPTRTGGPQRVQPARRRAVRTTSRAPSSPCSTEPRTASGA